MVYVFGSCLDVYVVGFVVFFRESFWVGFTLIPGAAGHQSWLVHLGEDILCRGGVADGQVALHWVESFSGNGNSMRFNAQTSMKLNEVERFWEMTLTDLRNWRSLPRVTTAWTNQGTTRRYATILHIVAMPTARRGYPRHTINQLFVGKPYHPSLKRLSSLCCSWPHLPMIAPSSLQRHLKPAAKLYIRCRHPASNCKPQLVADFLGILSLFFVGWCLRFC